MLRIVQGTIGSSSATSIRPIAVAPNAHSRSPGPAGGGEDDEGGGDQGVLGAEHRGDAEEEAGEEPRATALLRSQAHRKARIAAGRESIAGGSLITSPTEWMKGG